MQLTPVLTIEAVDLREEVVVVDLVEEGSEDTKII